MNHLLAEIKKERNRNNTLKILSEDEEIYEFPNDLDYPKDYDSDYKLEDDEWFHIPDFKSRSYSIAIIEEGVNSTDYETISRTQQNDIKFLVSYQEYDDETSYFFFQKITPSQYLRKRWFKISDNPTIEKNSPIIIIKDHPDAIYGVEEDTLYFKKLTTISSIFPGISELYKEATQEETEEFLDSDFINLKNGYNAGRVGPANRKRIAMAVATFQSFDDSQKATIFDYIKEYCEEELPYDDEAKQFSVSDEEGLKQLLWGIEQRYYTTRVGDERRVANSVSRI